jgi:beta-lactamase class A/glyoxylase-like metal-dependent hydrolase (beta-lactamase superfamily II)
MLHQIIILLALAAAPAAAQDSTAALVRRVEAIAGRTGGTLGMHALQVESGREVSLNGARPFFMSSVTKLPLAVAVLRRVDRGALRLGDTVSISPAQMSPGRSIVRERYPRGVRMTVEQLLRLAVSESDNTSNDALQRLLGGAVHVTRELESAGIRGIRADRPYTRFAVEVSTPIDATDPRDTATPRAMTRMLAALQEGRLLSPRSTALLLGWMTRTGNPPDRIVAGVPAGTVVAHKTGTWGETKVGAVNNVGVITLPGGRGHLAVALFLRNPRVDYKASARALAEVTRELYGHWAGAPRARAQLTPDVRVERLAPGLWLHETWSADADRISANGVLLETPDGGSVLFDTGWSDAQAEALARWAEGELGRPIRRAVATHAHGDRLGGARALAARGIPVQALALTAQRTRAAGGALVPDSVPGLSAGRVADAAGFELLHPGPGHTPDNLVAYFPAQRVLFGGCLVKSDTATTRGNLREADLAAWPATVARVRATYPRVLRVVPGHGAVGGPRALTHTERMFR